VEGTIMPSLRPGVEPEASVYVELLAQVLPS
jgi:hypothetical protein